MKAKMTCHPKNLLARSCLAVLVTIRFPDVLLIALLLLFIQLPASNAQDVPLVAALRVIYRRFASPPTVPSHGRSFADCPETGSETSLVG